MLPIITFIPYGEAKRLFNYKSAAAKMRWENYEWQQLATIQTFNKNIATPFLDLCYLKFGMGNNPKVDVWGYLETITIKEIKN